MGVMNEVRRISQALKPGEIRADSLRDVRVGLVATTEDVHQAMERFLCTGFSGPTAESGENRAVRAIRRATLDDAPSCDFLLCESNSSIAPLPGNGYRFDPGDPARMLAAIVEGNPELELSIARTFPQFRRAVSTRIIHRISAENAMFSIVSALPNMVPNVLELPWAVGEFASDTAFLTMNQIRMALQLAAAHGRPVGYIEQKFEIATIAGGAFGWRALARELVGKIPLGGGLIPKAAVAFAGTWILGVGLERVHRNEPGLGRNERREAYAEALSRGKALAGDLIPSIIRRRA